MASETLSQNEIDQLLGGADPAAQHAAPRSSEVDLQLYDFRRPHRVSKERLRALEAMYERLVKSLEAWLLSRIRGQVELRLQSVEQFSFGEFTLSLPTPCAAFGFEILNTGGQMGVIDVGHEFAYFLVDRFFGGSGSPVVPTRAMSPVERLVVRMMIERTTGLLTDIWQDHVEIDFELSSFESIPEMVQAVSRDDPVLVASIEVSAADTSSLVLICLPFSVLDKFFSSGDHQRVKAMTGSEQERQLTREVAEQSLRQSQVDVAVRFPPFEVPLRQLLGLPIGAVISTGIPTDTQLDVLIGGQPRFRAAAGRVGNNLAVRVLDSPSGRSNLPALRP